MSKHTPGPWIVDEADMHEDGKTVLGFYIAHQDSGRIGLTFVNCLVKTEATSAANAKLIAAAPELLEALRPFANFACDVPCDCHNCRARAAIAKATE